MLVLGGVLAGILSLQAAPTTEAPIAGETCAAALDLGSVPPDHFEPGIPIAAGTSTWRSFTLADPRIVRASLAGSGDVAPALERDCGTRLAGDWDGQPACLSPGSYHLDFHNFGATAAIDLAVEELGACFPERALVVRAVGLEDVDGDRDSFPDTGETARALLEISNKSDVNLTHLTAVVSSADSLLECVAVATIPVGALPARSTAAPPVPFVFRVAPGTDRAAAGRGVGDDYSAALTVTLTADQLPSPIVQTLRLELDLSATSATVATSTFVEGFESGYGAFQLQNLDDNRAANFLSYGYRCQYSAPRTQCGSECCWPDECECWLGFVAGQNTVNDWHIHTSVEPDSGRAFLGANSLHYGIHTPGNPDLDTYGLSQLDAVRTTAAIHLAARVCASDTAPDKRACNDAQDCVAVGGGPCVGARPELALVHQVSTMDARATNTPFGQAVDRAVVQVQRSPSAPWENLEAFENLRDVQGTDAFSNCMFDPVDDGNDEDTFFEPNDPQRRFGPSSTCLPEFVFAWLGDTAGPFDANRIGRASDGPGLAGSLGPGTWVRSRFDLHRYRGSSIRLRLLMTTIKVSDQPDAQSLFAWNPEPSDDGWYIDDIRVNQRLGAPVTLDLDGAVAAAGDPDGDGVSTCSDCDPLDATVWSPPHEATALRLSGASPTTLSWSLPAHPGAFTPTCDLLRSGTPADFTTADCLASSAAALSAQDVDAPPAPGMLFAYLVRSKNSCGTSLGAGSAGIERQGASCP